MRNFLGLRKLTIRELCILGLLTALTIVLAVYCTFRIGNAIKVPLKFITIFITAATFGPIWGGTIGAIGDILNSFLFPVGTPLPQITIIEFVYGFIFGVFFHRNNNSKYLTKTIFCSIILCIIDIVIVSYILTTVGYFPSFTISVSFRFPATVAKFIIYVVGILFLKRYINNFERLIKK